MTELNVSDDPKMLRETLCAAQSAVAHSVYDQGKRKHRVAVLQRLIDECDRHRPLGPDGKHGNRHTATCGCEDVPEVKEPYVSPGNKARIKFNATVDTWWANGHAVNWEHNHPMHGYQEVCLILNGVKWTKTLGSELPVFGLLELIEIARKESLPFNPDEKHPFKDFDVDRNTFAYHINPEMIPPNGPTEIPQSFTKLPFTTNQVIADSVDGGHKHRWNFNHTTKQLQCLVPSCPRSE